MNNPRTAVPLANLTTLKVGGNAAVLVEATTIDAVRDAVMYAKERVLPLFVLGGGSNILVPDEGYGGLVLCMRLMGRRYEVVDATTVHATFAAGEDLDAVIADTVERGLWGLENLSAIPGSVGAAPVQNVGAYGVEASDSIVSVTVFDTVTLTNSELLAVDCGFGYRDSLFKHANGKRYIVTAVTFRLSQVATPRLHYADLAARYSTEVPTQAHIREAVMHIRSQKFPDWHIVGTAGSFFKNPIVPTATATALKAEYPDLPVYDAGTNLQKISLGYVLDKICGLKGYGTGMVCLYEKQALVLVASPSATATHVIEFANTIAQVVKNKIGIDIEWEVVVMK